VTGPSASTQPPPEIRLQFSELIGFLCRGQPVTTGVVVFELVPREFFVEQRLAAAATNGDAKQAQNQNDSHVGRLPPVRTAKCATDRLKWMLCG
jgi:hypothetical protein